MQVKRFVAANMRLALKMVREEIGPDAVILSNKTIAEGVEILTAIDVDADVLTGASTAKAANNEPLANVNPFQQTPPMAADTSAASVKPSKLELELERMQRDSKQRAKQLAASLIKKNRSADTYSDSMAQVASKPASGIASTNNAAESSNDHFTQLMQSAVENSNSTNVDIAQVATPPVQASLREMAESAAKPATERTAESSQPPQNYSEDQGILQMRSELQGMRDLLEQQLSSIAWGQLRQQDPEKASMMRRLKRMGVNSKIASALIDNAANNHVENNSVNNSSIDNISALGDGATQKFSEQVNWQAIMAGLSHKIPVADNDLMEFGGVFAFVGPTGAGKTTTIGKLAARHVLKHGPTDIALITMDSQRIGAHEQLRTFGRILNIPVKIVDQNNSLEKALYGLRSKTLVLVDTSGLNRHDSRLQEQLKAINDQDKKLQSVLVLPATSQSEVVKSVYHTYKTKNLVASVVTKLDESMSVGEVLNLSIERQLPIAYTSAGQDVPDDIDVANATKLVKMAISLAHLVEVNDEEMAAQMVSLSDIAM